MQFNSHIFILAFIPIIVVAYFGFNRINQLAGKVCLIIGSAIFYIYGGWNIAFILGISILVNYFFSKVIEKIKGSQRIAILGGAILANIALLFYYKYFNFFITSINNIYKKEFLLKEIVLPLGISFFTFQQIMYLVNVYRKDINKVQVLDYLVYILFFPKLLMGPLTEPVELISQIDNPQNSYINLDNVSCGIKLFSFGLFKKLLLADTFSSAVSWGYNNFDLSTSMDWFLIMLFYTFEIYFDFSGYSDMALGVSKMLNIDLPMNFNSPYKAISIRDFWKRWHISLTSFLTKYVYIPLGGSKKGNIRTYVNILIVFLVSGIWHGANWTFILWGILHGILQIFDRIFDKVEKKLIDVVRWFATFFTVNILWILFRSDSIAQWKSILIKMFTFQSMEISEGLINVFVLPETQFIFKYLHLQAINESVRGFSLLLFLMSAFVICLIPENNYKRREYNNWITMFLAAIAFVWSFLCISSESVFVYFNF